LLLNDSVGMEDQSPTTDDEDGDPDNNHTLNGGNKDSFGENRFSGCL